MTLTLHLLGVEVFSFTLGEPAAVEVEYEGIDHGRLLIGSDVQIAPAFGFASYGEFFEDPVDPEI